MAYEFTSTSGAAGGVGGAATVAANKEYLDDIDPGGFTPTVEMLFGFASIAEARLEVERLYPGYEARGKVQYVANEEQPGLIDAVIDLEEPSTSKAPAAAGMGVLLLLLLIAFVFVMR